ncbi:hypothetical protein V8E36_005260 [Tilletia maclaganii]
MLLTTFTAVSMHRLEVKVRRAIERYDAQQPVPDDVVMDRGLFVNSRELLADCIGRLIRSTLSFIVCIWLIAPDSSLAGMSISIRSYWFTAAYGVTFSPLVSLSTLLWTLHQVSVSRSRRQDDGTGKAMVLGWWQVPVRFALLPRWTQPIVEKANPLLCALVTCKAGLPVPIACSAQFLYWLLFLATPLRSIRSTAKLVTSFVVMMPTCVVVGQAVAMVEQRMNSAGRLPASSETQVWTSRFISNIWHGRSPRRNPDPRFSDYGVGQPTTWVPSPTPPDSCSATERPTWS